MGYVIRGSADITRAPDYPQADVVVLNDSGKPYLMGMVMPNGEDFCYADSFYDLVCALIPDYAFASDEAERAYLRIVAADLGATIRQADIIVQIDPSDVTEGEWATLNAPKTGELAARADWWRCQVPLIAVTTSYEPFIPRPRPASKNDGTRGGTLWWVDPQDEESLITSLHEIGYIKAMTNLDYESGE